MVSTLRRIDPLVWFVLAGVLMYVAATLLQPAGERTIAVDRETMEIYLKSGGGVGGSAPVLAFDRLAQAERDRLIRRYVTEQVLYREGVALGLDSEDVVIRRRLGQTMRFLLQPGTVAPPDEAVLRAWFDANRSEFAGAERLSFDHVFFDAERRGSGNAREAAAEMAARGVPADWQASGDRFAYERSFAEAGRATVASLFGDPFARTLFDRQAAEGEWIGPVRSRLGWHLVRIGGRSANETGFEEVRAIVLDSWMRERSQQIVDSEVEALVGQYDVELADDLAS